MHGNQQSLYDYARTHGQPSTRVASEELLNRGTGTDFKQLTAMNSLEEPLVGVTYISNARVPLKLSSGGPLIMTDALKEGLAQEVKAELAMEKSRGVLNKYMANNRFLKSKTKPEKSRLGS